jgi:predicted nucleic acid-binding Zn ribbon protein
MPATGNQLALYVYRCAACGHAGKIRLVESSEEVTTACTVCGAEVLAEWDSGVELSFSDPGKVEKG